MLSTRALCDSMMTGGINDNLNLAPAFGPNLTCLIWFLQMISLSSSMNLHLYLFSKLCSESNGLSLCSCSRGLTFTWWGNCGLCFWHEPTELAHSFLFCSCVYFGLYGPFNCILFHKCSRQLSAFSLCSSGLISASLFLSAVYLFMKVSFSPDITPQWGAADAEIKVPSGENTEL